MLMYSGGNACSVNIHDAFVVKYSAGRSAYASIVVML